VATEIDTLKSLCASLTTARRTLETYDAYYEGEQPIRFIAPAMQEEYGERITALLLAFPRLVADAYEERLDVEGFRYAGNSSGDEGLWAVWQANDLDEQSQQAHLDAIALSRSYVIVGSGDSADDAPIVTVESPLQVFARRDPRTRRVISAVKRWDEGDTGSSREQHAVLYLPDSTTHYVAGGRDGWRIVDKVDRHELGRTPVVPLVNRPRILRPDGLSEFHDAIGPADAMNKIVTDMMVSAEHHAMPRRWATAIKKGDFQDENGNPISAWSRDAGTLWATESEKATFGQFREADLANFHNTVKLLTQIVVQLAGLPPHYASFAGGDGNPTSADAIRSSESRLVKRAERKQTYFGGSWEDVQRLVLRFQTGDWDPEARSLETIWRDPSTPTVAQKADATLKLATPIQGGRAIVPLEQARIDLGYTPEQRKRMAEMDRQSSVNPYLEAMGQVDGADAESSVGGD